MQQILASETRSGLIVIKKNSNTVGILEVPVGCLTPMMIGATTYILRSSLRKDDNVWGALNEASSDLKSKNAPDPQVITDQQEMMNILTKSHPKIIIDENTVDLTDLIFTTDADEMQIWLDAVNNNTTDSSAKFEAPCITFPKGQSIVKLNYETAVSLGTTIMQTFAANSIPQLIGLTNEKDYAFFKNIQTLAHYFILLKIEFG